MPKKVINKRITWNENHVLEILQYVRQIYTPEKEPYVIVYELLELLRDNPRLAVYSKNQLKMKLHQIKQAIDNYVSGSAAAGFIKRRVYFDLAMKIYGKAHTKSTSCTEKQKESQPINVYQFEQTKRFRTIVDNNFHFPKEGYCRLCQSTCSTGGVDLFHDTYENQNYKQLLQNTLFITIAENSDASRKICARCAKFLENILAFVQQCHNSNGILSISSESTVLPEFSVDNLELTGESDIQLTKIEHHNTDDSDSDGDSYGSESMQLAMDCEEEGKWAKR
ncbi:uncharacterized protein LOC128735019 [Sabethes cyaneus]|uniref:uncharacterized protein LOC128735019 n=1 Tax=Sabethes cyaneus TaxID=53552 RepID=UPI00237D4073|nr:uncharacterized protein LOC128735019 [Sabethes cyaneus]